MLSHQTTVTHNVSVSSESFGVDAFNVSVSVYVIRCDKSCPRPLAWSAEIRMPLSDLNYVVVVVDLLLGVVASFDTGRPIN